jgi:AraC-like DNA-binding protein
MIIFRAADTLMVFNFHLPAKNLLPFIKGYLETDSRNLPSSEQQTLFPNGYPGIFFNLGRMGRMVLEKEYTTPAVSVFGQIDQPFSVQHFPGSYALGVVFQATHLSKFLREDMAAFTNKAFDAHLMRSDFKNIYSRLEEESSIQQKINILNQYFTRVFSAPSPGPAIADLAIQLIHQHGNIPVKEIAARLNVSDRYLEMQFKSAVGLSPKTYSLIIRFRNAERQLSEKFSPRWSLLDFSNDYYDQNHFIKDFKRFTGHTPSDYLLKNFEMGRSYLLK